MDYALTDLPDRFRSKVRVDDDSGCWEWTAAIKRRGFPRYLLKGKEIAAGRYAYEELVESLNGRNLRSECDNRRCVNPAHQRPAVEPGVPICRDCGDSDPDSFPPSRLKYTTPGQAHHRGSTLCTSCSSTRKREKYRTDAVFRRREIQNGRLRRIRRLEKADAIKARRGCAECGEVHPGCLEFHHPDPETKEFNVSVAIAQNRPWKLILAEIAKCVVWCANCHRKHHYEQQREAHGRWKEGAA